MTSSRKVGSCDPGPTSDLRSLLKEAGAALVGFANLTCLNMAITDEFPFGICFALWHDDAAVEILPNDDVWLRMAAQLSAVARDVYDAAKAFIDAQAFRYATISSRLPPSELPGLREELPQKTLATLSGLGWIGKSALLVTPEHGPRVRLGTLVTDMPLLVDTPTTQSGCDDCTACVDACPVNAIRGDSWTQGVGPSRLLDVDRCDHHLWSTQSTLRRRQTCALCLKVCPFGIKGPV